MFPSRIVRTVFLPLALAFAGCASDMSAVTIEGFEFIKLENNVCLPSGTALVEGRLDTALGTGYMVGVNLKNELPSNADPDSDRANSNNVYITGVEAKFRTSKGAAFQAPAPETLPVSIFVPAGGTANAAIQVLTEVKGITLENADNGFLIVDVRLTGKTADGAAISSNSAEFPVKICSNCAAFCPGERLVSSCSAGQSDGVVCGDIDDGT